MILKKERTFSSIPLKSALKQSTLNKVNKDSSEDSYCKGSWKNWGNPNVQEACGEERRSVFANISNQKCKIILTNTVREKRLTVN